MARKRLPLKTTNLDKSPLHLLHRLVQKGTEAFTSHVLDVDLTSRQFAVLVAVAQHDSLSQTNLVEITGVDRSTMTDLIRRMLKKGFIQRRRSKEDTRAYSITLTEAGRDVIASVTPLAKKVDNLLLNGLGSQDRRAAFVRDLKLILKEMSQVE